MVEHVSGEGQVVGDAAASLEGVGEEGANVAEDGGVAQGVTGVAVKTRCCRLDLLAGVDQGVEEDAVWGADGDVDGSGVVQAGGLDVDDAHVWGVEGVVCPLGCSGTSFWPAGGAA